MSTLRVIIVSLIASLLLVGAPMSAEANAVQHPAPLAVPSGAPCRVSYFTLHARLRMAERDISEWEVKNAVDYSCRHNRVTWQWLQGTYRYDGTYVGVAMNGAGGVVTVWLKGGNGGGGWSAPAARQES